MAQENQWTEAKSKASVPDKKECEGKDCLNFFVPTWHTQRRCERCRQEKRPYKTEDAPF